MSVCLKKPLQPLAKWQITAFQFITSEDQTQTELVNIRQKILSRSCLPETKGEPPLNPHSLFIRKQLTEYKLFVMQTCCDTFLIPDYRPKLVARCYIRISCACVLGSATTISFKDNLKLSTSWVNLLSLWMTTSSIKQTINQSISFYWRI